LARRSAGSGSREMNPAGRWAMLVPLLIPVLAASFFHHDGRDFPLYPAVMAECPDLDSPLVADDGREYVIIRLHDGSFGLVDVTLDPGQRQLAVDGADFPALARTGLHDPDELAATRTITGRTLGEITRLASPGNLSTEGFLADDEDILSVLEIDDEIVRTMGLVHADLARPLLHVWNLMRTDLDLGRWSMAHHQWRNVTAMKYRGHWVLLDAHDTKGGQQSPFADDLEGAFWIVIRRPLEASEEEFLHAHYDHVTPRRWDPMHGTMTRLWIGEMEAHYIMWYGFYEGHTDWRADPVGIARIFGLRTLEELEAAFPGQLADVTTRHHTGRGQ
jgi:hypothetical protein